METAAIIILSLVILILVALVLILRNKLRQTNRTLRELIKENDGQQSNPQKTSGDIYFKVNKDLVLSFINESGADILGYESSELLNKPIFQTF